MSNFIVTAFEIKWEIEDLSRIRLAVTRLNGYNVPWSWYQYEGGASSI